MKTFVKTTLIATILLVGSIVNAQNQVATFGIKAGLNYSGQHGVSTSDNKIGFNVGITLDFRLSTHMYLLTGLEYTVKGAKSKYTDEGGQPATRKETPAYLQLPLHVGYMFPVSRDIRLVVHAGPYVAYGLGGNNKINEPTNGGKSEIEYFGDNISKYDWGLGVGVNAEYNRIVLGLGFDRGLRNFAPIYNDGKARTKNFYLTLGYLF